MKKQVALDSINEMPQDFDLDELFERLMLIEKIENGRQDVLNNQVFTHEEAKEKLGKWISL